MTDPIRDALAKIIDTYDAYRRRGVAPAPAEYADVVRAIESARAALAAQTAPVEPDDTCVICPECCSQFRAIPVQVQGLLLDAGYEPPFMVSARKNASAQPAPDDLIDAVSKALRRAWNLGQTYWQQADSDYTSQHRKADATQAKFNALVDETRAALSAQPAPVADALPEPFGFLTPTGMSPAFHFLRRENENGMPVYTADQLRAAIAAERAKSDALRTVMIAAAEEIAAHWDAHCDAEGYGPQNLIHRLEQGIPSEYGYAAGRFAELQAELSALREQLATERRWRETVDDMLTVQHEVASDDPRESINRLINWNVAVALDPSVSSDAQALIEKERERCIDIVAMYGGSIGIEAAIRNAAP